MYISLIYIYHIMQTTTNRTRRSKKTKTNKGGGNRTICSEMKGEIYIY